MKTTNLLDIARTIRTVLNVRNVYLLIFEHNSPKVYRYARSVSSAQQFRQVLAAWRSEHSVWPPRLSADDNPLLSHVYRHRSPVAESLAGMTQGIASDRIANMAQTVAGLRYAHLYPLTSGNPSVPPIGTLVILHTAPLNPHQKHELQQLAAWVHWAIQAEVPHPATRLLLDAEDRLRREVSEVLHGRVQTELLLLGQQIRSCQSSIQNDLPTTLKDLNALAQQVDVLRENTVRLLSHRLYPGLVQLGIIPALHLLQASYTPHITMNIDAPLLSPPDELPNRTRLAIYRVVEEALSNALHHGQATEVTVSMQWTSPCVLRVKITDNGHGFDANNVVPGLGFTVCTERVQDIGGTLEWNSRLGNGTTLTAVIPVNQHDKQRPAVCSNQTRQLIPSS